MSSFYRGFIAELEKKSVAILAPLVSAAGSALASRGVEALTKPKAPKAPVMPGEGTR